MMARPTVVVFARAGENRESCSRGSIKDCSSAPAQGNSSTSQTFTKQLPCVRDWGRCWRSRARLAFKTSQCHKSPRYRDQVIMCSLQRLLRGAEAWREALVALAGKAYTEDVRLNWTDEESSADRWVAGSQLENSSYPPTSSSPNASHFFFFLF